jgi:hypothetical protein
MINNSSSIVSKVTYDICSCSIVIEADSGETQTIPCDDIYEVWAIARVSEGMIKDANNDKVVERKWVFNVSSTAHPCAAENSI